MLQATSSSLVAFKQINPADLKGNQTEGGIIILKAISVNFQIDKKTAV